MCVMVPIRKKEPAERFMDSHLTFIFTQPKLPMSNCQKLALTGQVKAFAQLTFTLSFFIRFVAPDLLVIIAFIGFMAFMTFIAFEAFFGGRGEETLNGSLRHLQ